MDGPSGGAALAGNKIQSANFRERGELGFLDRKDPQLQVFNASKGANGAFADQVCGNFRA